MTLLVMTATIQPPANAPLLNRVAVTDRLEDYRRGLRHNLSLLRRGEVSGIVFVDNSGYGTDGLNETMEREGAGLADRVEFISYDAGLGAVQQTRFAGECKLLAYAFAQSRMIRQSSEPYLWKVTGRYVVRNLGRIVTEQYGESDLIVHCRNRPVRFVDFGVAGFRRSKAVEIMARILETPEIEHQDESMLRTGIDEGMFAGLKVAQRFPLVPDFSGIRGSDQASFDGLSYRMKYMARVAANRVFPQLWL